MPAGMLRRANLGGMRRSDDSAAFAVNWRMVLAVDALLGVVALVVGAWFWVAGSVLVGAVLGVAGGVYVALVARRASRWRRLRREAGLP